MTNHAPNRVESEHGIVFSSSFDLWVPALYLSAFIAFLGFAFDAVQTGVVAIAVFFLGLIPQAKMKRADLLTQLQERFNASAADMEAIGAVAPSAANNLIDPEKAAKAFYSKFWNLQILEFGLWRYGMLPSDSYAHWIVRRLLSFQDTNETYWTKTPLKGWEDVKDEFAGTDFRHFMDTAQAIGADVETLVQARSYNPDERYTALHYRIERLLVAVSGGGLRSTFVVRWFAATRTPLRVRPVSEWKAKAETRLRRESRRWRVFFVVLPIVLAAALSYIGLRIRPSVDAWLGRKDSSLVVGGASSGVIVFDPEHGVGSTFVVRFADEGSCAPGGDPRRWRGASLNASSTDFVARLARALKACSSRERPARVEVAGFASSADFQSVRGCGADNASGTAANVSLAGARAANVAAVLRRDLPAASVTTRDWRDAADMEAQRGFLDRAVSGTYDTDRGSLNRRAEIRILDAGDCGSK